MSWKLQLHPLVSKAELQIFKALSDAEGKVAAWIENTRVTGVFEEVLRPRTLPRKDLKSCQSAEKREIGSEGAEKNAFTL